MISRPTIAFLALLAFVGAARAMDFASRGTHSLEESYVQDCKENPNPHGYYGAFFQPCEFAFYQNNDDSTASTNACTDPSSTLLAKPFPVHWFFNLTDHFDKNDWGDSQDWDDMDWDQVSQKLFLWPDQCVGVEPRCYFLADEKIFNSVSPLFAKNSIPEGATHVQVNCQADAWMLSRTVFAFADGFEKSMPTIIAWVVTVVLLSIVALAWCIYGCVRLCHGPPRASVRYSYDSSPLTAAHKYQSVDNIEVVYPHKVEKA